MSDSVPAVPVGPLAPPVPPELSPAEVVVLAEIESFVMDYMREIGRPPMLGIVSRRFGKRVKAVSGLSLAELLKRDVVRFETGLNEAGATRVLALRSPLIDSWLGS